MVKSSSAEKLDDQDLDITQFLRIVRCFQISGISFNGWQNPNAKNSKTKRVLLIVNDAMLGLIAGIITLAMVITLDQLLFNFVNKAITTQMSRIVALIAVIAIGCVRVIAFFNSGPMFDEILGLIRSLTIKERNKIRFKSVLYRVVFNQFLLMVAFVLMLTRFSTNYIKVLPFH